MGTLSNQPIRATMEVTISGDYQYHAASLGRSCGTTSSVKNTMDEIKQVAKEQKVSVGEVIALYGAMVHNRHCDLMARDGDIKDEQLAGFGGLLEQLIESLARN